MISKVDHVIYAAPDLAAAVDHLDRILGVRAAPGGRHPSWATRNALMSLGPRAYLEIIGPDPEQPPPASRRPFGLDELEAPRLATWVAEATDLDRLIVDARVHGLDLGEAMSRSRQRPDGTTLSWRMTDPLASRADGIVPFFIDWGDSEHPATTSPRGCTLVGLRAEHPEAERVAAMLLKGLGLDLPVGAGSAPALIATLLTPRGSVELR